MAARQWEIDCLSGGSAAGAVFFSLVFLALTSLTTVDLLVNERGLVVKECLGGYYRPVSYYLSKGGPPLTQTFTAFVSGGRFWVLWPLGGPLQERHEMSTNQLPSTIHQRVTCSSILRALEVGGSLGPVVPQRRP